MAHKEYKHKTLKLECCVHPPDIQLRKSTISIRLPQKDRLKSIIRRIPIKFKFISNMNDNEWSLEINGVIVDKNDDTKFIDLLSSIPPVPVVKITKHKKENYVIITVFYNDKPFEYKLDIKLDDNDDDKNKSYLKLIEAIRKHFNLSEFSVYEEVQGDKIQIDDMYDILSALEIIDTDDDDDDDNKAYDDPAFPYKKTLKLYIEVENQIKIVYGNKSFIWVPSKPTNDDIDEWDKMYNELLNEINQKYNINVDDIELQQDDIEIDCGDELMSAWQALTDDDDDVHEIEIDVIVNDTIIVVDNTDQKQFKIIYELNSFQWTPPNINTHNSDEWENNFVALMDEISDKYDLIDKNIHLKDINDGNDLMLKWNYLINNNNNSTVININIIYTTPTKEGKRWKNPEIWNI